MSEPAQKCENYDIFQQNYNLGNTGKSRFSRFSKKCFITSILPTLHKISSVKLHYAYFK